MGTIIEGNGRPHIDAVDGRGAPIPPDPTQYLRSIALRYSRNVRDYQLNRFSERESSRGYFEGFRNSMFFRNRVYPAAILEAERRVEPPERLNVEEYGREFREFLFDQMAYADTIGKNRELSRVVLSPEEVFGLFHILYPHARVIEGHFGQRTLEGVHVPKGIVINSGSLQIMEVLEYELASGEDEFKAQYQAFTEPKGRVHRSLLRCSGFSVVTPKDFTIEDYHYVRGVQFGVVSVSTDEFNDFAQSTYRRYANGRNRTLVDRVRH